MSGIETDRANRKAARALFDTRLEQVKSDLAARSIGGRVADKAKDDAMALVDETVAVAKNSKGLIAATIAALLAWTFRAPLLSWIAARITPKAAVQLDAAKQAANDDAPDYPEEQAL
jgi:hypothetical protein